MGIMVDNITYSPVTGSLELLGYDVFRNGVKLNDALLTDTEFTDTDVPAGGNVYSVATVYDRGTSNACPGITVAKSGVEAVKAACRIATAPGRLTVIADSSVNINVWRIDGIPALRTAVNGEASFELPRGMYIVDMGTERVKVAL